MAPGQDTQLEKVINKVLKSGDVQPLDGFLQWDINEATSINCSQQFLTKLDKLVNRSLDQKDCKSASLGLAVLYKFGKNLRFSREGQGLPGLITQGLLQKWFEKCRKLWIQCRPQWDEPLFNLSEDFFDVIMVVHASCQEGTYKITEYFLYPLGHLAVDPSIYILIQKEAIRKFNLILDKIPWELKKKMMIPTSQESSDIMIKLAGQILVAGDHDFQTALTEALCRMATLDLRKALADKWFRMEHVASAFVKIQDSEFETDCRRFLNLVNGMQGDRRRVYSYPCLEVHLDQYELLMPADEKLDEFWIDFNLGSHSISFYFSLTDEGAQGGQWETMCVTENDVQSYTVTEECKRHILQLKLSELVAVGAVEGHSLTIHFSSSLDILQAARNVFGHSKNKGFVGKTSMSVVKTTVKINMEDSSSQVVPESQVSVDQSDRNTTPHLVTKQPAVQVKPQANMRMSESSCIIRSSAGRSDRGASSLSAAMSSTKSKVKPSLEMVPSCDWKTEPSVGKLTTTTKTCSHDTTPNSTIAGGVKEQNVPEPKAVDMVLAGKEEEQSLEHNFVPDTQPRSKADISSNWCKLSVSEILMMPTQKIPRPEPKSNLSQQQKCRPLAQRLPVTAPISQKQLHTELTQRLQQVLRERNQDRVPQEPVALQGNTSGIGVDSKDRSSNQQADHCAPTSCASKKLQAGRNGPAKGKNKWQMSTEVDASLIKAPVKASTAKVHERIPPTVKAESKRDISSKEKRHVELAGSMVKHISSHYKSTAKETAERAPQSWKPQFVHRPIFNMSWLSTMKREVTGPKSQTKANSKSAMMSCFSVQRKDLFTFNTPLNTGEKDKTFTDTSVTSISGIKDPSVLLSTTKNRQPVAKLKEKRHVTKHLFSDTDTDNATTELSWLRESSRKSKPKVTKYSRQPPIKPKAVSPHTSYESPDFCQKPAKRNTRPLKKPVAKPAAAAHDRPYTAGRRPQRAAATSTKSYKEPDTDGSQSEPETPPVSKYFSTNHMVTAEKTNEAAQAIKKKTASKEMTSSSKKEKRSHHISQVQPEQPPPSKKCFVNQQGEKKKLCLEVPTVKKRRTTTSEQSANTSRKLDSNHQSDGKSPSGLKQQWPMAKNAPETSKLNRERVSPVRKRTESLKDSWAAFQTSSSPPVIERMRSAQRSDPTLGLTCSPLLTPRGSPLTVSPNPPCKDTPSPILLLSNARSTVSSKGNLEPSPFSTAEHKYSSSRTQSTQPAPSLPSQTPIGQIPTRSSAAEISPLQQHQTSPPPSPLATVPLLTSTLLELDKPPVPLPPQSPFPENTNNDCCHYGFSEVSSITLSPSSIHSSVLSSSYKESSTAILASKTEKSPPSDRAVKPAAPHISGPGRKRHVSTCSNYEEDEKEERKRSKIRGQRSARMKPRKLFSSLAEGSADSKVTRVISSCHAVSASHWEAEVGGGDTDMTEELEVSVNPSHLFQQFSTELKKKFESRHKMIEVYNKQSLKTIQQHVSSLNVQLTKHRTQRLEKVLEVLLAEIRKLEQNDAVLKNMEKDLTVYWKKQSVAFHSYQEQENGRNETLKSALQSHVCHSLTYEESLFTSQMCMIRKDMKSVQDRLLTQMQEGEIQNVKRGLHTLFFP